MTGRTYTEHDLRSWLETTGQTPLPSYVDTLLARTARTPQRSAWLPERWIPMDITALTPTIGGRRVSFRMIAVVALVVLALVVGGLLVIGTQRRIPPPFGPAVNGLVAYVVAQGDTFTLHGRDNVVPHGDILIVDPVTRATSTLVGGPALDGYPVFSHDGTRVAFVRDEAAGQFLFVVDATGGEPKRLTPEPLPAIRDAAWSPDGASIAFTSVDGVMSRLWLARSDGTGATRVPLDPGMSVGRPQWQPKEGRQILLVGSTAPGFLPGADYQALWSGPDEPTGTEIGLYVVRPDGTNLQPITPTDGVGFDYGHAVWTPDGTRIVTQRQDPDNDNHLRVVVLAADGKQQLVIEPTSGVDTMSPVVSPDGSWIAYADMTASDDWRLRLASIDASAPTVGTSGDFGGGAAAFRWSPDGRTLVVTHHFYKQTWLVPADGGPRQRATWTDPGYPTWQRTAP